MADIINLRRARKAKDRQAAEAKADANRAKFGQTKAEKNARRAEDQRAAQVLAQHHLDPKDRTK